jgi:hypothetical protein
MFAGDAQCGAMTPPREQDALMGAQSLPSAIVENCETAIAKVAQHSGPPFPL